MRLGGRGEGSSHVLVTEANEAHFLWTKNLGFFLVESQISHNFPQILLRLNVLSTVFCPKSKSSVPCLFYLDLLYLSLTIDPHIHWHLNFTNINSSSSTLTITPRYSEHCNRITDHFTLGFSCFRDSSTRTTSLLLWLR